MVVLLFEVALICLLVIFLSLKIPSSLVKASDDNCYRLDGSRSRRRELRERNALVRIRLDLFAVLIIVALSGNLLYFLIDYYLIPLSIVSETVNAFTFNLDAWRDEISDRNLDRDYFNWSGLGQFGNSELQAQPHFVKASFPIIFGASIAWLICSLYFIRFAYGCTMSQYRQGIGLRCNEYLNVDIGRLQR